MNAQAEKIALFRYGLVAPLVLEAIPRGELTRRAQEIAARCYDIPYSTRLDLPIVLMCGVVGGEDVLAHSSIRYVRQRILC